MALHSNSERTVRPADIVIQAFGGVTNTARILGRNKGAVSQWKKTGNIPTKLQPVVLRRAKQMRLKITASEIILGR